MTKRRFIILNLTWGILMTLAGALTAAVLWCGGHRPIRHGPCLCFVVGHGWGGLSLGPVMIVSTNANEHTKDHELGHAVQNALYGPFMVAVSLHSAVRYWYRRGKKKRGLGHTLPPYDGIWFEGQATDWGKKYAEKWRDGT